MLSGKFRDKTHARIFRKTAKDKVDVIELESELSDHDTILTYKRKEVGRKTIKAQVSHSGSFLERKNRTGGLESDSYMVIVVEHKHISDFLSKQFLIDHEGIAYQVQKVDVVIEDVLSSLQLFELKNSGYEEQETIPDSTFW